MSRRCCGTPFGFLTGRFMSTSLIPPAQWAQNEFGFAQLGDQRRNIRLVKIAEHLAARPGGALPQADAVHRTPPARPAGPHHLKTVCHFNCAPRRSEKPPGVKEAVLSASVWRVTKSFGQDFHPAAGRGRDPKPATGTAPARRPNLRGRSKLRHTQPEA